MKPDNDIDPISAALRPKNLRRRITLLTLIPIVVAAVLIILTSLLVSQKTQQLGMATDSLAAAKESLDSVNAEYAQTFELKLRLQSEADTLQSLVNALKDRLTASQIELAQDQADEVSPELLETVALAGARFDWFLQRVKETN